MSEQGAIDSDFEDAEASYEDRVEDALAGAQTDPMPGGVAIDLVTRQAVFVRAEKYTNLEAHYNAEGYDLATYKMHPYLPGIDVDNSVFECVYLDGNPQNAHNPGKTYDFPSARLMHFPTEQAWGEPEVEDV